MQTAPELAVEIWPAAVAIPSTHNTPIEGFWRWKRQGEGHSIRDAIFVGKTAGIFNPNNQLHMYVHLYVFRLIILLTILSNIFNWLWPPLVQERLDIFRDYWNNHRLSSQKHKLLPTGTSPRHMWTVPDKVRATARQCFVNVDMATVRQMRMDLGGTEGHDKAFRFVTAEFEAQADAALAELKFPQITLSSAWDVFVAVNDLLSNDYN